MEVTIFKNISDINTPFYKNIDVIFDRIKNGNSKELIEGVRNEKDSDLRNKLKKNLPSICFSGKFTKRADSAILEHSGFICLDFDKFKTSQEMQEFNDFVQKDKYTFCSFVSPSGNGYKVIVKVPKDKKYHKMYFDALKDYYDSPYFDTTSKNISRVCYESYDPNLFINRDSELWTDKSEFEQFTVAEKKPLIKVESTNDKIKGLMVWFEKKYDMNEGGRNNNLWILASAMNDYGIPKFECVDYCNQFAQEGFGTVEIARTVDSAYSNYAAYGSKYFENSKAISDVSRQINAGVPKKEIKKYLEDEVGIKGDDADIAITEIEKDTSVNEFWYFDKNENVRIVNHKFKYWLEQNGFFKLYPETSDNFVFVRKINNLISDTSEDRIKDFVMKYLEKKENIAIYEFFSEKSKYFKEDYLNILSEIDLNFNCDTKTESYLYFKNKAVKVTKDGYELIDYMHLNGYVWEKHIIDRDFERCEDSSNDFGTLISNISNKDEKKNRSTMSTIGYLCHSYKSSANNVAVILNDELISDNPNGGTGKGIFISALSKLKKVVVIDGKSFDQSKSFPYQTVSADTHLLVFDDVKKSFNFEMLFSLITEGITLEKKNKDAVKLGVEKSPKILISTNYAIKGDGNSFNRRKWDLEFAQHYQGKMTPEREFGRLLFGEDWTKEDWVRFDNYMIECIELYLKEGLIETEFNNLDARRFIAKTSFDFYEWAEDSNLLPNVRIIKGDKYHEFVNDNPEYKRWLTQRKFSVWIDEYGKFKDYNAESGRGHNIRWIRFEVKPEVNF